MRTSKLVQPVMGAAMVLSTVLMPAPASAATITYPDRAHDIGTGADILGVRVNNARRVVVTVRHRNLQRTANPHVALYIDTRPKRPGPEFVLDVNVWEYYLWPTKHWQGYGDAPLACHHGGTFNYRTEKTYMPISRACLGYPGRVRVSVVAADACHRRDWAPGYHAFSTWVPRH